MARPVCDGDEVLLARLAVALAPAAEQPPEHGILALRDAVRLGAQRTHASRGRTAERPLRHRTAVLWGGALSAAGAGLAAPTPPPPRRHPGWIPAHARVDRYDRRVGGHN